jgi:hypothetical protein
LVLNCGEEGWEEKCLLVQEGQKRNLYEIAGNKEKTERRGRRNW